MPQNIRVFNNLIYSWCSNFKVPSIF